MSGQEAEGLDFVGTGLAPDPGAVYDCLIVGGGPAAMTAAVYAARKVMRIAVLTEDFGGQVAETSEIENYIGFQLITGHELTERFVEHVKKFEVPCARDEKVVDVTRDGDLFTARREGGEVFRGRTVVFATGRRYRKLGVPGERELSGHGVSYCVICDAPFFRKKKVVIAGGGNSAFTAAADLLKLDSEVTLVNIVPDWQADHIMFDPVEANERAHLLADHEITRIEGKVKVEKVSVRDHATGEEKELTADGVFVEIGGIPNSDPVKDLVKLNRYGEIVVDCNCRTSVEGLFAAGDVTTVPYKQIVISAGEGSKAALAAYDHLTAKGLL
jgi:alkyl hydroperoxide reductase subunit F